MILLIYPKFVGGKFISNCLALSRHCVAQDRRIGLLESRMTVYDKKYYDFKLAVVMKSLPKLEDMNNWLSYEYGCFQLYGIDEEHYKQNSIRDLKEEIAKMEVIKILNNSNKQSCIISHDYRTAAKYMLVHPNATIIEFDNFDVFRDRARAIKSTGKDPDYEFSQQYHRQDQDFFKLDSFKIDVDTTFFDWPAFDDMMRHLYGYLGFDDYDPDRMYVFWDSYIQLHT